VVRWRYGWLHVHHFILDGMLSSPKSLQSIHGPVLSVHVYASYNSAECAGGFYILLLMRS
jgi:hypothetical protein